MEVIKDGRRIVGFVEEQKDGSWTYAFGKPSQREYIAFNVPDKNTAIKRILEQI